MAFVGKVQAVTSPYIARLGTSRLARLTGQLLEKLRMHHVLFVAFTLVAAVPVIALATWVAQQAVQQEIHLANDKHLLVARNLETAFSRYVFDVKAAFQLSISAFYSGDQAPGLKDLLNALVFRHVCIVNGETGEVERYMPGFAEPPNGRVVLNPETLEAIPRAAQK